jgi:hypothetical protein
VIEFLASPAGLAIKLALLIAFVDLAVGVGAALRDNVFSLDKVAAFLRKHVLGRILPASLLAVFGYLTADLALNMAAAGALTAYYVETAASLYASVAIKGSATVPTD